jgi:hypothetical protein
MHKITLCLAFVLAACGGSSKTQPGPQVRPDPPSMGGCIKTGCSGTVCSSEPVITTCEFKPEYACYKTATCKRQPGGDCGWTQTPELIACLANPPPAM